MERPLELHVSALSEQEYNAYTCILRDIVPGGEWETADIPVGEAKGWIRGKYGVDAILLDKILRLFPATITSMKATQFLAVLRLISHAQTGHDIDKSLVFEQAQSPLGADFRSPAQSPRLTSPALPSRSPYQSPPVQHGGRQVSSEGDAAVGNASLGSNPFRRSLSQRHVPPRPAQSYPASIASDEDGGRRSPAKPLPSVTQSSQITRAPSATSLGRMKKHNSPAEESRNPFFASLTPPVTAPPLLPPRKGTSPPVAPILPPPQRQHHAPPIPPKPSRKPSNSSGTGTSTLIRQSLMAAKTAQKLPEQSLQSMKSVLVVGTSRSNTSGTLKDRVGAASGHKSSDSSATLFSRAESVTSQPSSASSLEYVANARPPATLIKSTVRSISPSKQSEISPSRLSIDEVDEVVQRGSPSPASASASSVQQFRPASPEVNSAGRPIRSKSLHGTTSSSSPRPPVPTPPPRRRRPESVQVAQTSPFSASASSSASAPPIPTAPSPFANLSRRASIQTTPSSRTSHSPSHSKSPSGRATPPDPFGSFVHTMKHLPKATENLFTPELSKFASKAEGGLAPGRGYISHRGVDGARLVNDTDGDSDSAPGMDLNVDDDDEDEDEPEEPWRRPTGLERGGSTLTVTPQRQAVQAELDRLRGQRNTLYQWGRMGPS